MSEFSLFEVLQQAVEVEYNGERLTVIARCLDIDTGGYITVLARLPSGDWLEVEISLSKLKKDSNLKVFHSRQVGFSR